MVKLSKAKIHRIVKKTNLLKRLPELTKCHEITHDTSLKDSTLQSTASPKQVTK